jgi:peptidoglycan/xylan/chitin deacetylase (PgdA/CDA1 family)
MTDVKPLCAISVDLDPLACYYQIHGLGAEPAALTDVIMKNCLPRFGQLFAEHGIPATFFVVARDVDIASKGGSARSVRSELRELRAAGHEIASHTYSHPYRFSRLPRSALREEIARAHGLLSEVADKPIVGFRAPGYNVSGPVLEVLCELGYLYDSSVLPAPGYYTAKALIMMGMAVVGKKSGAVLTDPRNVLARSEPYRPSISAPWRVGDAPLIELPITVTSFSRTPAIGTTLLLSPPWLSRQ